MDDNRPMSKNGVLPLAPANKYSDENRPLFDEEGRCHGYVEEVIFEPARTRKDGCELPDGYCWRFICPGTLWPYVAQYWTGAKWTKSSKLLALWKGLGLSQESPEVDRASGLPVVFKLERKNEQYKVVPGLTALDADRYVQASLL
jgi:hypothetical protein